MNKDLYNKMTDNAWNKVYARIEEEGFTANEQHRPFRKIMPRWGGISAAACVLLCIVLSVLYLAKDNTPAPLLTQINNDATFTLVKTLEDGTIVYLANHSSLVIPKHFSSEKREVTLNGNAYFDVTHKKKCPFVIKTKEAVVEVLGTAFYVRSSASNFFELSVNRGRVSVTKAGTDKAVFVDAGRTVTCNAEGLRLETTKDHKQFNEYKRCIRFKDETLGNILRAINKQNDNKDVLQTIPSLNERKLTVSFCADSPTMIATLISQALHLRYTVDDHTITIK